jgi:uncharacterized SAM-dependent methyltransferase
MKSAANILIHESQFPENVRRDLLASLRARKINHKFHYDSIKQAQKWLALHRIYSPTRNDADCAATYDKAFAEAVKQIKSKSVHVIGLGCGGGQKDTRLLKLLKACGRKIFHTPCDVSAAMVLMARQTALAVLPEKKCFPFVCDLATAKDLPDFFEKQKIKEATRLVTFFGMIPNFEPREILPKLAKLIRPKDFLLFSANLAPGKNYADGMKKILPQYDNLQTRDWLLTFPLGLGIEKSDGGLKFEIAAGDFGLKRLVANFHFKRARQIKIENETFNFKPGEKIRLLFSYRYTPELVSKILSRHKLKVCGQWIAKSEEEGVFLCCRK